MIISLKKLLTLLLITIARTAIFFFASGVAAPALCYEARSVCVVLSFRKSTPTDKR